MKKILFLQANGLGDRIAGLPYLTKMKEKSNTEIYLLDFEDKKWNNKFTIDIIKLYKKNNLFKNLLIVPRNKIKLLFFFIHYMFFFDEVYIPIKQSNKLLLLGKLLGKKITYTFKTLNDNTQYENVVDGLLGKKCNNSLFYLNNEITFPYNDSFYNKFKIQSSYTIIFVGTYSRSLLFENWLKVFQYLKDKNITIILVGSSEEKRESWILNHLTQELIENYGIINLIGKTNFTELCSIIKNAELCITANGGVMWLSHKLNKNIISFSTCSGYITHPPINNKTSFHIYKKTACLPCEQNGTETELLSKGFKKCIFHATNKEAICKKNITFEMIKTYLDTILK